MEVLNLILGVPLGYVFYFCYAVIPNYGIAILLFTLLTKIILFPLSIMSQKNSIIMVKLQPALDEIKQRFAGNSSLILDEQRALYKSEHYSMVKGMLPLLFQIPIILGLIAVIYNPLQHLLHLDAGTIQLLLQFTAEHLGVAVADLGAGGQLAVMEYMHSNPEVPARLVAAAEQIKSIDMGFLYVDMAVVPSFGFPTLLYPIISGLSALGLSAFQNKYNVLQQNQGFLGKWGVAIFLTAFSFYFALVLPCGVGLYWIAGNILSMAVLAICNVIYNPKKLIDFSTLVLKPKPTKEQKQAERALKQAQRAKSRVDAKRFYKVADKQLVIYSEASGFYKYFARIIAWLLNNTDITIHYVTSDLDDNVFSTDHPHFNNSQFQTYFIGNTALISFMMKIDADMVLMTMPDLETFHIKRSLVRKDVEYVYLDHGVGSFHLMLREHALDGFNTIFTYGPNHIDEVKAAEQLYNLSTKTLVETGYALLDDLIETVAGIPKSQSSKPNNPPVCLIAPSWQIDNILDYCFAETVIPLISEGFKVIVRPHPEYNKRFEHKMDALIKQHKKYIDAGQLVFELDFISNSTVYTSDVIITDWSSIAQEFAFTTKKPVIFINTPMKVMNPNWEALNLEPLEISMRPKLGAAVDVDKLNTIGKIALDFVQHRAKYKADITKLMKAELFNIGQSAEISGQYIQDTLAEVQQLREAQQAQLKQRLAGMK